MRRPVEEWAKKLSTPLWLFRAAKRKFGWAIGKEATEAEYKDAMESTKKHSAVQNKTENETPQE